MPPKPLLSMVLCALVLTGPALSQAPLDLVGRAHHYSFTRNFNQYYWREDFSFTLDTPQGTYQVISREPTPAYHWRLGTTYPPLRVDWGAGPRVRVYGVAGVDRDPPEYYGKPLQSVLTAQVVWVETASHQWREFYLNNWFHKWGPAADQAVARIYANQPAPYDIYGFVKGQALPFSASAQALLDRYPGARMFHGLVRGTPYRIDLLHIIGQDDQGNGQVLYGDPNQLPKLDERPP